MLTLIIGGAASGKSEYAESLALQTGATPRTYLATMQPYGDEAAARIERHRALRAQKGFVTIERYSDLAGLRLQAGGVVLLECMGNLVANELFPPENIGVETQTAVNKICLGVARLQAACDELIIVSNEVFCGGKDYEAGTLAYLAALAWVNRALAQSAANVAEMVAGVPIYHKGGPRV